MEPCDRISPDGSVKTPLDELTARVARLEAVYDIVGLEARYARTWDTDDADGWAGLFLPDGTFRCLDLVGRPGFVRRGSADLAAFCREFQHGMARLHLLTTYDVTIGAEGTVARGRTGFECHRVELGPHPHLGLLTGHYETDYVLTVDGWRIRDRVEHLVFNREERYYADA